MSMSNIIIREIVSVYTNDLKYADYCNEKRPYSAFCIKLSGSTVYKFNGREYLSDSTLIFIPKGASYDDTIIEKGSCVIVDFIADNIPDSIQSLRVRHSSVFKNIASSLQYAWSFKRSGYRELCLSLAYQMLYQAAIYEKEEQLLWEGLE